jgi:hypothetical protein
VDHGAGLEGVVGPLVPHEAARDAPQLGVDGSHQPVSRVRAAGSDLAENGGQILPLLGTHP